MFNISSSTRHHFQLSVYDVMQLEGPHIVLDLSRETLAFTENSATTINGTIVVPLVKNRCAVCLLRYHMHTFAIKKMG